MSAEANANATKGRNEDSSKRPMGMSTTAIHTHDPDLWSWRPIILPLSMSTIFKYETLDEIDEGSFYYSRCDNPTRKCLEQTIAKLENADHALCFSSGMSSVVSVIMLLKPGDHVICSKNVYGGVTHYFNNYAKNWNIEMSYVDLSDPENLKSALKSNTKLVWMEGLTNPTLQIVCIEDVSKIIKNRTEILLGVDNTFLTPFLLKPLDCGADIVMNSISKYLNGHGDVLMGVLATNNHALYDRLRDVQKSIGNVPSPMECFLVNRSLKTLKIRMQEHCKNALKVAQFLETHPLVEKVIYPGLPSHSQHELAKTYLKGFGGMTAFYLKGNIKTTEKFLKSLKTIYFTASLGLTESVITFPWSITHPQLTTEEKGAIGITETLVRLSVGLEDPEDLIDDLKQALETIKLN